MSKLSLPIMAGDRVFEFALQGFKFLRESWLSRNYTSITINAQELLATHILRMVDSAQGQHFRLDYGSTGFQPNTLRSAPRSMGDPTSELVSSISEMVPRANHSNLSLTPIPEGESLFIQLGGREYRLTVYSETFPETGEEKKWLTVTTKGKGKDPFVPLVEAVQQELDKDTNHVYVFTWVSAGGYWRQLHKLDKRPIDTVILPNNGARKLLDDTKQFFASRQQYLDLGVPFRRGYLLHGLPRSGKSATILAIASELGIGVHVLNLSGENVSDETVIAAFTDLPQPAILVLEDIDVMSSVELDRSVTSNGYTKGVSLSTLLNCLDGSYAGANRLVFMTTNHPEKLDPALIGAGRVDVQVEYRAVTFEQVVQLWELYYPTEPFPINRKLTFLEERGFVVADIQACFQKHLGDPEGAVEELQILAR